MHWLCDTCEATWTQELGRNACPLCNQTIEFSRGLEVKSREAPRIMNGAAYAGKLRTKRAETSPIRSERVIPDEFQTRPQADPYRPPDDFSTPPGTQLRTLKWRRAAVSTGIGLVATTMVVGFIAAAISLRSDLPSRQGW
jgi:hypothetical protein